MTIDIDRLRGLTRTFGGPPENRLVCSESNGTFTAVHVASGHESTMAFAVPKQGGEFAAIDIDKEFAGLICAAVDALPALLAVYEAACAWADWHGSDDTAIVIEQTEALWTAVDAARGKVGA